MPLRGFIFMLVFMGVISADFRPEGAFWQYSAAFADDDDDDDDGGRSDDDDDDDGVVIRRQVQPQRRVRAAPAPPPPSRAPDEVIARGLNEEDLAGLQTTGFELIGRSSSAPVRISSAFANPKPLT